MNIKATLTAIIALGAFAVPVGHAAAEGAEPICTEGASSAPVPCPTPTSTPPVLTCEGGFLYVDGELAHEGAQGAPTPCPPPPAPPCEGACSEGAQPFVPPPTTIWYNIIDPVFPDPPVGQIVQDVQVVVPVVQEEGAQTEGAQHVPFVKSALQVVIDSFEGVAEAPPW